ncbi:hypothetical protein WDJ51_03980 [Rathayibacter sp. YIM 133350]|uniref:three-helix bundle dimerization domain-containing protein n=1 Tax=Rathayibacter sp. YIM 133350 TaxID=3131992 RepID=UPI00307EE9E1
MRDAEKNEQRAVDEVVERLSKKFPDVDPAVIAEIVHAEHLSFTGRPVRDFVPVLVEKSSKARLKERARTSA